MDKWLMFSWVVFALTVGLMIYLGFRAKKVTEGSADGFLVAGRTLGPFVGTCAVVGTGYSGWCFMGAPGVAYAYGPIELLFNFGFAVSITAAIMFFAGRLRNLAGEMGSTTIPEYISQSHAHSSGMHWLLQGTTGLLTAIFLLVFLVGQIKAVGLLTSQWLAIPDWVASTLVIAIIVFYTAFGGLAAVAWTDTIMVIGMVIACLYCCFVIFTDISPIDLVNNLRDSVQNYIAADTAAPYGDAKFTAYLSIPYAFFFAAVLPYMAMRFLGFKKGVKLHVMGLYSAILCIILSLIPVVGMYVKYKMPGLDLPDNATPVFLANFVPPVAASVITVFILFAMQSTANGLLHTLSSAAMHDVRIAITKDKPVSMEKALSFNRAGVIIFGIAGMLFTYVAPSYFLNFFSILGTGTLQAILIGPVFVGSFWRGNAYGCLAAMLGGGVTAAYTLLATDMGWVLGPLLGDVVAVVLYIGVSKMTMGAYAPVQRKNIGDVSGDEVVS